MKPITEILPTSAIILDKEISSKKRLFEELGTLLASEDNQLAAHDVFECLFARERLGSTGLGQGVAIPHGRHAGVLEPRAAFIRLKEAIDFDAPDGKPVNLVFALLVPEVSTSEHLDILSHLAERFSDKTTRAELLTCHTPEIVLHLLNQ